MPVMESVTLENFRCFREKQTVKLAPLTLLVGENSTGKTSFLAGINLLANFKHGFDLPMPFSEEPFDLGSFDSIVNKDASGRNHADTFLIGYESSRASRFGDDNYDYFEYLCEFQKISGAMPSMSGRRISLNDAWYEEGTVGSHLSYPIRVGTANGSWGWMSEGSYAARESIAFRNSRRILPGFYSFDGASDLQEVFTPLSGSPPYDGDEDGGTLTTLTSLHWHDWGGPPFVASPTRSTPRRTYDPTTSRIDPEGSYAPMVLVELKRRSSDGWLELKGKLERFGQASGLFQEIEIRPLGEGDSDPFQVTVRRTPNSPWCNLKDVGYGIGQVLPILTGLFAEFGNEQFLIQEPEVDLHPSAQAALGSLFCEAAGEDRQIIVETHSDHLINRVRMDTRDGTTRLKPDDLLILFFQPQDQGVSIHEITLDEQGNICGAPDSYRDFFRLETRRSLGL